MLNIGIIKLGADGDVIRTLPLAKALKEKYPDSEITWITKGDVAELLKGNPYITKVYRIYSTPHETFDILYNFDIEEEAASLVMHIPAKKKYGFYSEKGYTKGLNWGAECYLNTIFDDEIKKNNKKTYQEMMFEAAEIPYRQYHDTLYLTQKEKRDAEEFLKEQGIKKNNLIGVHMGASSRWPSKVWAETNVIKFISLAKSKGYEVLLFGGPNEIEKNKLLSQELFKKGHILVKNNPTNAKREFAALVDQCKAMLCSDSFSLHVALALKKPTIGLFFCTNPYEIESYGLLCPIVSPLLERLFPGRMNEYDAEVVQSISAEEVLKALESLKIKKNITL